jgi:S-DNA-T family DNA segregation ATPase FtsK/SpoIIIE
MKHENILPEVAKLFITGGLASVQLICRKFNLPYNEAFEIMQQLEDLYIVGPFSGSKTREILIKNMDEANKILSKK